MALIDITIENPSLISTGEDAQRPDEDDESGLLSDDQPDERSEGGADDDLGDTLKNVSTLLTAATTVAGVLKQLRDDEGSEADGEESGLFADEEADSDDGAEAGEEEVESFVENVVGDGESEVEDEPDETEEAEAETDDSSGLGLKVALVLVVVLVALALWSRGDDEDPVEDWE
ncbi:MAG: hypothetical protein QXG03_06335 [Halalkalicoccus sp.]